MSTSGKRATLGIALVSLGVLVLFGLLGRLDAYDMYSDGQLGNCAACHESGPGGFQGRGPLHDAHVNSATGNCQLCHTRSGDIPFTNKSGEVGGLGCIGCHGQPQASGATSGAGLRLHHARAGAPPDPNGLLCVDCHFSDPAPRPENVAPAYYARTDVIQKSSCNVDGKEDFWNRTTGKPDGRGLDNDGDLLYDSGDSDCAATACVDRDGDGYGDPGDASCAKGSARDCDDARADVYPGAVEAYDQVDDNCNGEVDEIEGDGFNDPVNRMRYTWKAQPPAGQLCDVIRSDDRLFPVSSPGSICLALATPLAYADDAATPALGKAFYFLVRNTLVGDYGKKTDGTLRQSSGTNYAACP